MRHQLSLLTYQQIPRQDKRSLNHLSIAVTISTHKLHTLLSRSNSNTTDAYRLWNSLSIGS